MKLLHWIYPELPGLALLAQLTPSDVLLLRQDGCYTLPLDWPTLPCRTLVLATDLQSRGLKLPASWQAINDADWVALAAQANQVVLWPKLQ
ncbi:DsrH/TusB family sulfur metabolism protein [Alkalimonas delamerensis]|uniref:DsrH/TusB family sulfur metabolism protein n=1 Tax=Alkalimonas delamerensis TaxID=265981 RepID=A0ABT9GPJ4_9GAMM|nr:DsrH/TusB family sulfur metabolism protein [Alkalimonas delamerensis]MDP4528890.1 DsrH/TusB family sulfur metabolism protein [Alkalimonas delamerensis]